MPWHQWPWRRFRSPARSRWRIVRLRGDGRDEAAARLVQQVRQLGGARLHDVGCGLSARFDLLGHVAAALEQLAEGLGGMLSISSVASRTRSAISSSPRRSASPFPRSRRRAARPRTRPAWVRDSIASVLCRPIWRLARPPYRCALPSHERCGRSWTRRTRRRVSAGFDLRHGVLDRPVVRSAAVWVRVSIVSCGRLGAANQQVLEPPDLAFQVICNLCGARRSAMLASSILRQSVTVSTSSRVVTAVATSSWISAVRCARLSTSSPPWSSRCDRIRRGDA